MLRVHRDAWALYAAPPHPSQLRIIRHQQHRLIVYRCDDLNWCVVQSSVEASQGDLHTSAVEPSYPMAEAGASAPAGEPPV
jgi:hypothetical protein